MPKREIEPILQTWLFFGFIHEVLGTLCKPRGLTCDAKEVYGHRKVLTTSYLTKCLRLTKAVFYVSPESFNQALKLSLASLGEMIEIINILRQNFVH